MKPALKTRAIVYLLLKFFQFCGMCPISLTRTIIADNNVDAANKSTNRVWKKIFPIELWSIVCLILFMPLTLFLLTHKDVFIVGSDAIDRALSSSNVFLILLAHFLIILEALLRKTNLHAMWKKFHIVNQYFLQCNESTNKRNALQQQMQKYAFKFWLCCIFSGTIELVQILSILSKSRRFAIYWSITVVSVMMIRIRSMFGIMFMDMLTGSFGNLNCELRQLAKSKLAERLDCKLAELMKVYFNLFEITENLTVFGDLSGLMNLSINFLQLFTSLYWAYVRFKLGRYDTLCGKTKTFLYREDCL